MKQEQIGLELIGVAIDRVIESIKLDLPKEIKYEIIKDAKAIAQEWEVEEYPFNDIEEEEEE